MILFGGLIITCPYFDFKLKYHKLFLGDTKCVKYRNNTSAHDSKISTANLYESNKKMEIPTTVFTIETGCLISFVSCHVEDFN